MTSKLTREEMLARAKENVKALRMASRQHAFESARSEILADLQIAEYALSCLESEPVAWQIHTPETGVTYVETNPQSVDNIRNGYGIKVQIAPLYRHAKPAPVVPDEIRDEYDEILESGVVDCLTRSESYAAGWNACRAAMLNHSSGSRKEVNSPEIPEGYVLVPREPTETILDEFDSIIDYGAGDSRDAWNRLIAAAPQGVTSASPIKK